MAAPTLRLAGVWYEVTYTASTPELRLADVSYEITYEGIMGLLDYIVARVVDVVGHGRVYNRHRHPRNRLTFEQTFVDSGGLEFWTVRRPMTQAEQAGNQNALQRVHTIQLEGLVAHADGAVAASSPWPPAK